MDEILENREENAVDLAAAKQHFSRMGLAGFAFLLVGSLLQILVMAVVVAAAPHLLNTDWGFWVMNFAPLYLVAFPLALLILRRVPRAGALPEPESFGFGRWFGALLIGMFLMYAGNLIGLAVNWLIGLVQNGAAPANPIDTLVTGSALLPRILIVVILGPIVEELLFRRALIDRMRLHGEKLAVVTSALMFGLFHGNLSQFFYAFFLGLVFGYVYLRSGKLRYTIALHICINALGSLLAPTILQLANGETSLEQSTAMMLVGLYGIVLIAASVSGLVLLLRRRKKIHFEPAEQEVPKNMQFSTVWLNLGMILFTLICLALIVIVILGIQL